MLNSDSDHLLPYNKMTLAGKGRVTATPDIAVIRLGVQTNSDNLTNAQQENARISQEVIAALRQLGVTDIKTFDYTIEKQYDYQNGNRIDRGYNVRNIIEIRSDNMEHIGTIIDTAVANGANIVDFISFEVSDSDYYYNLALKEAILNAYKKATAITESLGVSFDPIPFRIIENTTSPTPYPIALREGASYTTPIEPGSKQIEANVTVVYLY
jgi:uncharacterized protein